MISTEVMRVRSYGNGSTKTFSFPFKLNKAADLKVSTFDGTTLKEVTNYTITPSDGGYPTTGGTVTYPASGTAVSDDIMVIIERDISILQSDNYKRNDTLSVENIEKSYDTLVQEIQQANDKGDRAVKMPENVSNFDSTLPTLGANESISTDETGTKFVAIPNVSETLTAVSEQASAAQASANKAANSAAEAATSEANTKTLADGIKSTAVAAVEAANTATEMANAAAVSAASASTSASNAAQSETNTKQYEDNANSFQKQAEGYAQNAAVSEENAALSETNAALSESNALNYATAADTSKTEAAASEKAAKVSETNAAKSAEEAKNAVASSVDPVVSVTESDGIVTVTTGQGNVNTFEAGDPKSIVSVKATTSKATFTAKDGTATTFTPTVTNVSQTRTTSAVYRPVLLAGVYASSSGGATSTYYSGAVTIQPSTGNITCGNITCGTINGIDVAVLSSTVEERFNKLADVATSGSYSDLADTPTALKNPNALTFTGAVTGSYDGSAAKTVNIPNALATKSWGTFGNANYWMKIATFTHDTSTSSGDDYRFVTLHTILYGNGVGMLEGRVCILGENDPIFGLRWWGSCTLATLNEKYYIYCTKSGTKYTVDVWVTSSSTYEASCAVVLLNRGWTFIDNPTSTSTAPATPTTKVEAVYQNLLCTIPSQNTVYDVVGLNTPVGTNPIIKASSPTQEGNDGDVIAIGSNGMTIVGGGEYPNSKIAASASNTSEELYLGSDSTVYIETNANTFADRKTFVFNGSGDLTVPNNVTAPNITCTGTMTIPGGSIWIST